MLPMTNSNSENRTTKNNNTYASKKHVFGMHYKEILRMNKNMKRHEQHKRNKPED